MILIKMAYLDGLDKHDRLDKRYELAELIEVSSISTTAYRACRDKRCVYRTNPPQTSHQIFLISASSKRKQVI